MGDQWHRRYKYDRGQWAIERERFQISNPFPPSPAHLERTSDVVLRVMKNMGLESRTWEERLQNEWIDLVGTQIAKNARPGRMNNKILHIFVNHSIWLDEISRYSKKDILHKLQERFGADTIADIKVALDPDLQS